MTAEEQLVRIAKLIGFDRVWPDPRPGVDGLWFAERDAEPGMIQAAPLEALLAERLGEHKEGEESP